tara:strand:+ start:998 stop:1855 length:858 start_codon:yes stop_codon:yes gene_type:complete
MKTNSNKISKGIVFGGCSFTWGQGLYYYSNLPTLKEPAPDAFDGSLVTDAHRRYGATLRYPRLVANHFNTFEVCMLQNGGSEETTFQYLKRAFGLMNGFDHLFTDTLSFDEIEYIIVQTSQPNRSSFVYTLDGVKYDYTPYSPEIRDGFFKWLKYKNLDFDKWYSNHVKNMFNQLKDTFSFYESKGIKTLFLNWENDYHPLVEEDSFMSQRFIPLHYKGKTYNSIRNLTDENQNLVIYNDLEHFSKPPRDHHPSKECHQVMASSIIDKINTAENSNLKNHGKKFI